MIGDLRKLADEALDAGVDPAAIDTILQEEAEAAGISQPIRLIDLEDPSDTEYGYLKGVCDACGRQGLELLSPSLCGICLQETLLAAYNWYALRGQHRDYWLSDWLIGSLSRAAEPLAKPLRGGVEENET